MLSIVVSSRIRVDLLLCGPHEAISLLVESNTNISKIIFVQEVPGKVCENDDVCITVLSFEWRVDVCVCLWNSNLDAEAEFLFGDQ